MLTLLHVPLLKFAWKNEKEADSLCVPVFTITQNTESDV